MEYKGKLLAIDNYMNLQLDHTYECMFENGERKEELIGEIFIRCNNVLYIREDVAASEEADGPIAEKKSSLA